MFFFSEKMHFSDRNRWAISYDFVIFFANNGYQGRSLSIIDRMYSECLFNPIEYTGQSKNIRRFLANILSLIGGFDWILLTFAVHFIECR